MRLATGLAILGVSVTVAAALMGHGSLGVWRLSLVIPAYGGFLSILEGTMSFCVFHASRGTYDFFEKLGAPWGKSESRKRVESEDWLRKDLRKARLVKLEALGGAVLFVALLFVL